MDSEYKAIITLLVAGAALIPLVVKRPGMRPAKKKSNTGWLACFLLGVPMVGMVLAGASGNETLVWVFGIGFMLAVPLWFFISFIFSLASVVRKGGKEKR